MHNSWWNVHIVKCEGIYCMGGEVGHTDSESAYIYPVSEWNHLPTSIDLLIPFTGVLPESTWPQSPPSAASLHHSIIT